MSTEYSITPDNLFFVPQNGCMYVGCGESHADHSTVHSQVSALPRSFTSYATLFTLFICTIAEPSCAFLVFLGLVWFGLVCFHCVAALAVDLLFIYFGGIHSYDILSYFLC